MKKIILLLALLVLPRLAYADLTLSEGEGTDVTKVGSTVIVSGEDASTTNKGIASFNASDFDVSSGAVSVDYTNGQVASHTTKGFLTSADWDTFNGKQAAGSYLTASNISDTAYGAGWDNDAANAPSKNAVYDKIASLGGGHDAVTVTNSTSINLTLSTQDITANLNFASLLEGLIFSFESFGQTIQVGKSNWKPVPYNCTVTGWEVVTSASGSTVVDILKSNYTDPTTWASIAGTEIPNTTTATKGQDLTLSSWTVNLTAGDYLMANVTSSDVTGTAKVVLYGKRR